MKRLVLKAVLIASILASGHAVAEIGRADGTVNYVWTYGDGRVLVSGFAFENATCSNNNAFYIPANHPYLPRLLAVILSAKATGSPLSVYAQIDNCWYPMITEGAATYIVQK